MRRAAQSVLLLTAAMVAASAATAGDPKVIAPVALRGVAAKQQPQAAVKQQAAPAAAKQQSAPAVAKQQQASTAPKRAPAQVAAKRLPTPVASSELPAPAVTKHSVSKIAANQKPVVLAAKAAKPSPIAPKVIAQKQIAHSQPAPRKPAVRVVRAHATPSHMIAVPMDEVRVVQFSQAVSTVYVGNPMVADISIIDPRHVFVLGKSFGDTNLIALDANGRQIVNNHVSVLGHTGSTVTLSRGKAQVTYACAGVRCERSPIPGDEEKSFKSGMEQVTTHMDVGLKSASGKTASSDNNNSNGQQ